MSNSTLQPLSLREIGYFYGGLTGKSGKDFGRGNSKYITFMNVINNVVAKNDLTEFVEIKDGERQNKVSKGDLLFNGSSETPEEVAFPSLVTSDLEGLYLNSFCFGFRFEKLDKIDPLFFAYYLRSNYGRQFMSQLAQGSTRYNISKRALLDIEWNLPKVKEQKAIAEALSDIDGFILNSRRLFSKKINVMDGLVGALVSGQYFKKIGAEFHFDSIKNLGVDVKKGELITEKTAIEGGVPVIAGGVSAAYYHNTPNRTGITVTISASGANAGYVNIWKQPIWASDCSTISESSVFDLRYLYYILKGNQENIYRSQYGGAQPHVRPNEIEKIVIPWTEKRNQKEIADLLDDFSNEIKNLETSIQKNELLKQGMMNDLLTGKVGLA